MNNPKLICVNCEEIPENFLKLARRLPWVEVGYLGERLAVVDDCKEVLFVTDKGNWIALRDYLKTAVATYEGNADYFKRTNTKNISRKAVIDWIGYDRRKGASK